MQIVSRFKICGIVFISLYLFFHSFVISIILLETIELYLSSYVLVLLPSVSCTDILNHLSHCLVN